jgi:hypothetical protein
MRLPGVRHGCGPLLELGWVSRQLRLSQPVTEGVETIPVASIIGTAGRGRDFDGCWHATQQRLAQRLDEIHAAAPVGMDEPIEAVRVGRAYFVVDGHKRVALAKRTGREFLDAQVRHLPSPYELAPDAETEAILRTAREGEFRRHSGLAEALPDARFALTTIDDYGELYESVRAHGLTMAERDNRPPAHAELGADWYRSVYEPAVSRAREEVGDLLLPCTDADIFLLMHRQQLAAWGGECDDPVCIPDQVRARRRLEERGRLPRIRRRVVPTDPAPLLPLHSDSDSELDRSPAHGS